MVLEGCGRILSVRMNRTPFLTGGESPVNLAGDSRFYPMNQG